MTADEIMHDEMLKAGVPKIYVDVLAKVTTHNPFCVLKDDTQLTPEQEYRLRKFTREMLQMSDSDFAAAYDANKWKIEAVEKMLRERS
jgi:hypothetical protein